MRICCKCVTCHLVFLAVLAIPLSLVLCGIKSNFTWSFWKNGSNLQKFYLPNQFTALSQLIIAKTQPAAGTLDNTGFVCTQAKPLFYLPKLQDFLVVSVQSWVWRPKGSAGGTKMCCCSLSRRAVWSAPLLCASLRTECCGCFRGVRWGRRGRAETVGYCHSSSVWHDGPCSFISSGCLWRFEFHAAFTLEVKHVVCSTGVKDER